MIQTSNRNFWIAQGVGWSLVGLSNFTVQYMLDFPVPLLLVNTLMPIALGLAITTAYRFVIRKYHWQHRSFGKMMLLLLGSTVVQTMIFMVLVVSIVQLALEIKLSVPHFLSNFFIFFVLLLNWNVIYLLIHYSNHWHHAEVEKWQMANEMKDAQLGALKSQINPHFVFNTINNIRSLILEDKEKARDMLLHFSELFRYALNYSERITVSLEQELAIVRQYLELASLQYEERLQFCIKADASLQQHQIPLMMLQLLVENAIKHGISQHQDGGKVWIAVDKRENSLYISVSNTGSLTKSSTLGKKIGIGLDNIQKRLHLIYDGQADFQIAEEKDIVLASIKIPAI